MITETRARYDGVSTRVLSVAANGTPIVLLHGFADSVETWRGVMSELEAAGHAAIAVDLPGFGAADTRRPGELMPQLDSFVDAIVAELGPVILASNAVVRIARGTEIRSASWTTGCRYRTACTAS
ncbi:MAG: alpha/beta hydrolase [Mycobacterium sp.]|nr:alpha/beta hydrolase [Mycobacterium sp.]